MNNENDFLKKIDEFFFLNYKIPISLKKKNITKYKFTMLHKTLRFFKYLKKIIKLKYLKNLLYINRYFYYLKVVYDYSVPKKLIINKNINENIEINNTKKLLVENQKLIDFKSIESDSNISKISVIGMGMMSQSGVAKKMFTTLADNSINILAISTSEIKISVLINKKFTKIAVKSLHDAYNLGK